jgi:hypothetical protein
MAARRLILVMLGLLGISILLSFVIPQPESNNEEEATAVSGTTGTTGASGTTGATGTTGSTGDTDRGGRDTGPKTVTATLNVDPGKRKRSVGKEPCASPGSRLVLTVTSPVPVDVGLPAFGRTASVTPYAPAVFDLLLPEGAKQFSVTDLATGDLLGEFRSGACSAADGGTKDGQGRAAAGPDLQ